MAEVEVILEAGEAAFPELAAERAAIRARLQAVVAGPVPYPADLFLASACLLGLPTAIARFEKEIIPQVSRSTERALPAGVRGDEVIQELRRRLFTGESKLASYGGRGPLAGWTRAVAMRLALDARGSAEVRDEPLPQDVPEVGRDLELRFLYNQHRELLKESLAAAFGELTARERTLLRLHLVEEIALDRIGVAYGAHKSTISRWVSRARQRVLNRLRAHLAERLRLEPGELSSLLRAVGSQMSVSLKALNSSE